MQFRISSLKDTINTVIPHFEKFPLITQKQAYFILFKKIVYLMNDKEHLTIEGIQKFVNLRSSMNLGLSEELRNTFLNTVPVKRPIIQDTKIIDPLLAGFTSGEGSFMINITKPPTHKIGVKVQLRFQLTQHSRDEILMKS
uniref:Homing endonuclease LAGLIDADG domain-containing protein n=1 Tax=Dactylella sp. TaxID=1814903 RepID=A0A482DQP2_9PEZI|nr:hypothetical protein [Dactylella sp.]